MANLVEIAKSLSRFKKERYLSALTEDAFRDHIVRPLFLRLGYGDGRDLCGPNEKGRDTIFSEQDKLGFLNIIAVQTKKGKINLAKRADANLLEIIVQLRTALGTPVLLTGQRRKVYPQVAILCTSGKINDSAKEW